MGRVPRLLWRAIVALMWLLVALLGVEVGVRVVQVLGEYDAKNFMNRWYEPVPLMRPATPEEAEELSRELRLPRVEVSAPGERAPGPARATLEPLLRFRELLSVADEDERTARAALDGDCWIITDAQGNIQDSFGDPDPHWLNIIPQGIADLKPGETRFIKGLGSPLWDYEVTWFEDEPGTATRTYRFHNTSLNISLAELSQRAAPDPASQILVPSFALKPNLTGLVTSDQFGFPNRPVALPKPPRTLRILCFGGSTTYESDVGTGRTTEYLQQLLQESVREWSIEVINCGIAGATSFEMRRHAHDFVKYQPDLIIYYEGINDTLHWVGRPHSFGKAGCIFMKSAALRHFFNRQLMVQGDSHARFWRRHTRVNLITIATAARDAEIPFVCASFAWPRRNLLSWREKNFIDTNARITWGSGVANYFTLDWALKEHNRYLKELCMSKGWGYLPFGENFHYGLTHFHDMCHFNQVGRMERARRLHAMLLPWVQTRAAMLDQGALE